MNKRQQKLRNRILLAFGIFLFAEVLNLAGIFSTLPGGLWIEFVAFLIPYLIAGHDVLKKAWHGITHRQPFDENLLMALATIGAFLLVLFPEAEPHMAEGAAVMLFYQVGELFESYAVGKTRTSIAKMMDIAPEYANVMQEGSLVQEDPSQVAVGSIIVCKPGERIPLDGIVVDGTSQLDTSALTGESMPHAVEPGSHVASGCVNMAGALSIQTTSAYEHSTVARILDLVENASEKKARTENFITRFARYYTPIVVALAAAIAIVSPLLLHQSWSQSVQSALIFLVVSCPCALVISVPLSFFGGIGAASRLGIMVKGSNYLEVLSDVDTIAFDKTGTLTSGTFGVVDVHPAKKANRNQLLYVAAHAEAYSDHPIARSVVESYPGSIDHAKVDNVKEISGEGISASLDSHTVLVGNNKLMQSEGIEVPSCELVGTVLHVSLDGTYLGHLVIADMIKDDARTAIEDLRKVGIARTIMLTGDREEVACNLVSELGINEYRAQLLPQDKVAAVEDLLQQQTGRSKLAFVGDGINDAPVLMRADVGIAMGGMGADAAIEAADIVIMDDKPSRIASAVRIARKTLAIARQNIVFALAVKIVIMVLALPMIGISTMWLAVFGDVGVSVLAILNAMRCLRTSE